MISPSRYSKAIQAMALILAFATSGSAAETAALSTGLEGAMGSNDRGWDRSLRTKEVSPEDRTAEKAARADAIKTDIARLNARLKTTPSPELTSKLHSRLKEVIDNKGLVEEQGMIYGIRDIEPILKGQDQFLGTMLDSLIQLNKDFAKRDIDMIYMPLAPTPFIYSHDLINGIDANNDYTPGWTKMLLSLLENDIEIIDPIEEYRAASKDKLVVNWANDFHTGDGGRLIAAKMLAERLQRYGFVRDLAQFKESYSSEEIESPVKMTRISVVNGQNKVEGGDKGHKQALQDKRFSYLTLKRTRGAESNLSPDLVMIGDSQLHSAVYGSGWPAIAMSQIGGTFRWGSRSGDLGSMLAPIYLTVVPDYAEQPRVVVVTSLCKYFWKESTSTPRPMPELGSTDSNGVPTQPFECTVEFLKISKTPVEDPRELDYDTAFFHAAVRAVDGPLAGQELGIRYYALNRWLKRKRPGQWHHSREAHAVGKKMKLRLLSWSLTKPQTKQAEVFDNTDQDLMVPVFIVQAGPVHGKKLPQ